MFLSWNGNEFQRRGAGRLNVSAPRGGEAGGGDRRVYGERGSEGAGGRCARLCIVVYVTRRTLN